MGSPWGLSERSALPVSKVDHSKMRISIWITLMYSLRGTRTWCLINTTIRMWILCISFHLPWAWLSLILCLSHPLHFIKEKRLQLYPLVIIVLLLIPWLCLPKASHLKSQWDKLICSTPHLTLKAKCLSQVLLLRICHLICLKDNLTTTLLIQFPFTLTTQTIMMMLNWEQLSSTELFRRRTSLISKLLRALEASRMP